MCEYCESSKSVLVNEEAEEDKICIYISKRYKSGGEMQIFDCNIEHSWVDFIPISFCPMCGQPLTEPKPLTLEQLKAREGKPVWIKSRCIELFSGWYFIGNMQFGPMYFRDEFTKYEPDIIDNYSKTWWAFDGEVKED